VLLATGSTARVLPFFEPDGERVLTGQQVYGLEEVPEHLIVVGSGATGAEFANAFRAFGAEVTLVSSRDLILPTEDPDAAEVIEAVFERRGMTILRRSRAVSCERRGDEVVVGLQGRRRGRRLATCCSPSGRYPLPTTSASSPSGSRQRLGRHRRRLGRSDLLPLDLRRG
jgi:pyruvate/2-oxoglutarate dehydrogenase complex dihydrolipoamide dehydrogenase (E3) component